MADAGEVTGHLERWVAGDEDALSELMDLVGDDLRRLAGRHFARQRADHTLQPTALVNELYLRLADVEGKQWPDRARFFAFAATAMRNILVDHARSRESAKRGGGHVFVALDEAVDAAEDSTFDLLAIDDALTALAEKDKRQARIVELRAFGGLSVREVAAILEISEATVVRDWAMARAWLFRRLNDGASE